MLGVASIMGAAVNAVADVRQPLEEPVLTVSSADVDDLARARMSAIDRPARADRRILPAGAGAVPSEVRTPYGGTAHEWLEANGPAYGWHNPQWAQADGSKPEPWHWEFDPTLLG